MNFKPSSYYHLFEDYDLIVASFATQYGIRLQVEKDMNFCEFLSLLKGLNGDTPLGQVVSIRSENRPERLKELSPSEHRIRREWLARNAKKPSAEEQAKNAQAIIAAFKSMQ